MSERAARIAEVRGAELRGEDRPPLLQADDPPPYELVNPEGKAPVLFLCDHASRAIPAALDDLGLDETALCRHIAWDIGAIEVAQLLAARFDAPLAHAGYSRLVIDPNRDPEDPTSIVELSDGVVIPGNRGLGPAEVRARRQACFEPYHEMVEATLEGFRRRGVAPAVISVHSFTPVFKGFERPWHYGVLWNQDPRLALPLIEALGRDNNVLVGDNQPYSGKEEYGYSVQVHAERHGLPHVLLELRQDLVDTHHGAADWARRAGDALAHCLARDEGLFRVVRY